MNKQEAKELAALLIGREKNGHDIVDQKLLIDNGCSTTDDVELLQSALKLYNYNLFYVDPERKQYQLLHDAFEESEVIAHRSISAVSVISHLTV
jgi:hypothetical protein